ncbi:MAG: acetoacetate decarboxylase family protein [Mogibacterium sp.]|nr:acetoacetate decarboxylase family protein [Mogibacterium sp.]
MYDILFQKGKIGNVELKNRLVMSPMGSNLAELDGSAGDAMIAYYEERAKGGCGLIMPEICRVNDATGAGSFRQLSVTKDRHIEGLAKLAAAVHKHGSKIFIQLHHPGREGVSKLIGGKPCVSASDRMCLFSRQETRALTLDEVHELIEQFSDGAVRCQKAGIDGIELHCAHGYLLEQFLSPYTNFRTDEYGGNFENRMRFVKEIIEKIREKCGPDYPVGIRLSVDEMLEYNGVKEDYITLEEGVKIVKYFEEVGIDFIDVSCGIYETMNFAIEPTSFPEGWRRPMIQAVKDAVKIPVMAVSAIRSPEIAAQFIEEGVYDFAEFGRTWLAEPEWGVKVQEGRISELNKCINCLRCFETLLGINAQLLPFQCAVNPRMGREFKLGDLEPAPAGKTAIVVGGGPGGMYAARTLAQRGVKVTLFDRKEELGGTINLAKLPPLKERMQNFIDYMSNELGRLGVDVKLGKDVSADDIAAMAPDAVVLATGSKSIVPSSIPGADGANVFTVEEALTGKVDFTGKHVAMIGAGLTGLEAAECLGEKGIKVTIVDMVDRPAPTAYFANVMDVMSRIRKMDVTLELKNALKAVEADGVCIENVETGEQKKIECDAVVMSLGYKPDQSLKAALEEKGLCVKLVGSAIVDGTMGPATRSGYDVGAELFRAEKPSFIVSKEKMAKFATDCAMKKQEGIYMLYSTDPAAIRRILPAPLEPYSLPLVYLSANHINEPTFADNYYESILGVYATYKGQLGLYCISLVLGGQGAEMATALGRDVLSIPKKVDAEFVIRKDDAAGKVTVGVSRRGTQLIDMTLRLGEYNHPMTHLIFQAPSAGRQTQGYGYYMHFDQMPDAEGGFKFNTALTKVLCKYDYKGWIPAFVEDLKLKSSVDDPWAELPVETIIGAGYSQNDLYLGPSQFVEEADPDEVIPKILPAWYDLSAFGVTGRK